MTEDKKPTPEEIAASLEEEAKAAKDNVTKHYRVLEELQQNYAARMDAERAKADKLAGIVAEFAKRFAERVAGVEPASKDNEEEDGTKEDSE